MGDHPMRQRRAWLAAWRTACSLSHRGLATETNRLACRCAPHLPRGFGTLTACWHPEPFTERVALSQDDELPVLTSPAAASRQYPVRPASAPWPPRREQRRTLPGAGAIPG